MEAKDLLAFMAKGAPGALIIMSPNDLKGFADEVRKEKKPRPAPVLRGLNSGSAKAEILQAIVEVWPGTRAAALARALGVTRQAICKLLAKDISKLANATVGGDGEVYDEDMTLADIVAMNREE